jgi:hypothetical protein
VAIGQVYPGIDLVFYGREGRLEYDFVVNVGGDPADIRWHFEGAAALSLSDAGDLVVDLGSRTITHQAPRVFQEIGGAREPVAAFYHVLSGNEVGFEIGSYDAGHPLVIDPVLIFSTLFGGDYTDRGRAIEVDAAGYIYVAGETSSTDFPTAGSIQTAPVGSTDVFVTKLDNDGTSIVYSTIFGGAELDYGNGLAVDSSGNAYVTGKTASSDFPTAAAI